MICGVLLLFHLLMALNIMFCSLTILLDLHGSFCSTLSLKFLISLFILKPWLKHSFLLKLRPLGLMVAVNTPQMLSKLTSHNRVLFTKLLVHTLLNRMVWLKGSTDIFLKPPSLSCLKLPRLHPIGLMQFSLLCTQSIFFPHLFLPSILPGINYILFLLIFLNSKCLAVLVMHISDLMLLINLLQDPINAYFLATL